jgi:hypothetical protein
MVCHFYSSLTNDPRRVVGFGGDKKSFHQKEDAKARKRFFGGSFRGDSRPRLLVLVKLIDIRPLCLKGL